MKKTPNTHHYHHMFTFTSYTTFWFLDKRKITNNKIIFKCIVLMYNIIIKN